MAHDRYPKDLEEIKKRGVQVIRTPESVLQAQLQAWTKVMDANKDPFFQKVYRIAEGLGEADRAVLLRQQPARVGSREGLQALLRLSAATRSRGGPRVRSRAGLGIDG